MIEIRIEDKRFKRKYKDIKTDDKNIDYITKNKKWLYIWNEQGELLFQNNDILRSIK